MAEVRRIKPAARRAQERADARQKMLDDALSVGDTIEYSATVGLKTRRGDAWLKFGVNSTVRPGETGDTARIRVVEFVIACLDDQTKEYVSE